MIVYRKVSTTNGSCLRIVDIYGDLNFAPDCTSEWVGLLQKEQAEYVDCIQAGWPPVIFKNMGFRLKTETEMIPEYFEPLVKKNVAIRYAVKPGSSMNLFFKGDGDQDRPNMLNS